MKKVKKAAAIKWNKNLPAPLLTAKGEGAVAEAMIRIAKENGVEIVEETELTDLLIQGELMEFIPYELYETVAQLLVTVYNLNSQYGNESI